MSVTLQFTSIHHVKDRISFLSVFKQKSNETLQATKERKKELQTAKILKTLEWPCSKIGY